MLLYTIIYYYIVEYTRIHSRLMSYNAIAHYTMQSKPVEGRDAYGGPPPVACGAVPHHYNTQRREVCHYKLPYTRLATII